MKRLKIFLASLAFTFGIILLPFSVQAQNFNDFVINDFSSEYTLTNNDKQGSLHVVEDIRVTFNGSNHGILRALPNRYKGHSLQLEIQEVRSDSGAPTDFTTSTQNDNTVLKIGAADKLVTGPQAYRIEYDVHNVIGFYEDHTELYWNVNGTQWQQPFERVSATVHLPKGIELTDKQPLCFTGTQGSSSSDCTAEEITGGGQFTFTTARELLPAENLTYVMGFKNGYFAKSTGMETFLEYLPALIKVVAPIVLFGGYSLMRWRRLGRDAKGRGTIVPQYDSPKGMTPVEVGTLVDFNTSQKDITAMIIDLAIRGYIVIHEDKIDRKILKDKTEYSLELKIVSPDGLRDFELKTLQGIFSGTGYAVGTIVKLSDLKNKFYTSVTTISAQVKTAVVSGGYFKADPTSAGGRLWGLAVILFVSSFFMGALLGGAVVVGLIIAMILTVIFAALMPARTELGTQAFEHAKGLKMYLSLAEADRIKMLQSPDSPYAENGGPHQTVKLFEKLLPYAMIFGVEKEWAKQFEGIYKTPPNWYAGSSMNAFSAGYLASSLGGTGFGTAMTTSFSSPSSSGSSGFSSGGGFSGGGGGGGGGGGW